jgi:chromosome segregation ATPase
MECDFIPPGGGNCMLNRAVSVAFFWLLVVAPGAGQTQDSDSQTLRQILMELRAIHEDMRVTESTQLLVAELQMQQAVVDRAAESADNAREKLDNIHRDQQQAASDLGRFEENLDKITNPDEKNDFAQRIEQLKGNADLLQKTERDANQNLQDMQLRLQNAEDKLSSIEAELSAVIARPAPGSK